MSYKDERTDFQKRYEYITNIPIIGFIYKLFHKLFFGNRYFNSFANTIGKHDENLNSLSRNSYSVSQRKILATNTETDKLDVEIQEKNSEKFQQKEKSCPKKQRISAATVKETNFFRSPDITTVDDIIDKLKRLLGIWDGWKSCKGGTVILLTGITSVMSKHIAECLNEVGFCKASAKKIPRQRLIY